MDAAEYVVSEDDRMALAALALDSLSDAVSDESILHFIATLDTEAELQLIIRTGETGCIWGGVGVSLILILSDHRMKQVAPQLLLCRGRPQSRETHMHAVL